MKRHQTLYPLSHHHHHALVMALHLKRATEAQVHALQEELRRFAPGSDEHFHEEEAILLPAFAEFDDLSHPDIQTMLFDHVNIRSLVNVLLRAESPSIQDLQKLGHMLEKHIRLEERIIFPMIEQALPEDRLKELAPLFHDQNPN